MTLYAHISPRDKRRYYLHKRLSPSVSRIMAKKRLIFLEISTLETLTKGQRRNLAELQRTYGYSVQSEIPQE